jgi:hypothetical protein
MDLTGLGSVADLAKLVVGKVWPDKTAQEQAEAAAALVAMQGQLDANKAEAASPDLFVSGWRPFVGWVCGLACAWNWIGLPVGKAILAACGQEMSIAPANLTEILPLLLGLLGMGSLRTYEKTQGVASK